MRTFRTLDDGAIERRSYRPPSTHQFDVEIVSARALRKRASAAHLRRAHRIDFYLIILVTRGSCDHVLDFERLACKAGSVLIVRPSQAHQFDVNSTWDGWLLIFRPEFLYPWPSTRLSADDWRLNPIIMGLLGHVRLNARETLIVRNLILQMLSDLPLEADRVHVQTLVRHQLCALLLRIGLTHRPQGYGDSEPSAALQRFEDFRNLVERSFVKWHRVQDYAQEMGCTQKTLSRMTFRVAGISAKAFIASRIRLEAKRMLVHTSAPIAAVADKLGFADPSNFVKFFKREAGCVPLEFRKRHRIGSDTRRG